jgi:predicted metal-dependent phosphoesterase TrpH
MVTESEIDAAIKVLENPLSPRAFKKRARQKANEYVAQQNAEIEAHIRQVTNG